MIANILRSLEIILSSKNDDEVKQKIEEGVEDSCRSITIKYFPFHLNENEATFQKLIYIIRPRSRPHTSHHSQTDLDAFSFNSADNHVINFD